MDLGGGHNLVLTTTFERNDPDRRPPSGGARTFLEFFVDGDAAVDAKYDELTGAGYRGRRPPFRTDFGAWMALVDDPDGNTRPRHGRLSAARLAPLVGEPGEEGQEPVEVALGRRDPDGGPHRAERLARHDGPELGHARRVAEVETRAMSSAVIPRAASLAPGLQKQPVRTEMRACRRGGLDLPEVDDPRRRGRAR